MLSGLFLRKKGVIAVLNSAVECNKTFGSSYEVSLYEARVSDIERDLVLGGSIRGAVEPDNRCYLLRQESEETLPGDFVNRPEGIR